MKWSFVVFPGSYLKGYVQNKIPNWDFDSTKSLEVVVFNRAHPGFLVYLMIHLHSTQEVSCFFYLRMLPKTVSKRGQNNFTNAFMD
ncbi:MAG: hypothetical protein IPM57_09535 [Oligoflexia bacterium]|nr:hypothetical protein [Oligoflexia bacterium]